MVQRRIETRPVQLEVATPEDAGPLTVVAALAFFDDRKWMPGETVAEIRAMDDPSKGPPHTSYEWTRQAIDKLNADSADTPSTYYKVLLGNTVLVGGLLVIASPDLGEGEWRCEGIFVDPDYHDRGVGQEILRAMYRLHPDVVRWSLGTPEWAVRNRHFYEKMGFTLFEITDVDPETGWRSYEYENVLPQEERLRL
jgi:GNAT superfamily N-acetyltransferase